ncbi:MAG: divergent polysaccharide deacetylase family protein [Sulfitobacter sp.]
MAQGILGGIGLGAAFSVGMAGLISVLVPIEPQPAPETALTAGLAAAPQTAPPETSAAIVAKTDETVSAVQQPQPELATPTSEDSPKKPQAAAQAPKIVADLEGAEPSSELSAQPVAAPQTAVPSVSAPAPTTLELAALGDPAPQPPQALPQPQTGTATDLTTPRPLPSGVKIRIEEDAPVLPIPQALAPMIPDETQDADVAEGTSVPLTTAPLAAAPVTQEEQGVTPQEPAAITPEITEIPVAEAPLEVVPVEETPAEETPAADALADEAPETAPAAAAEDEAPVVIAATPKPRILPTTGAQGITFGTSDRPRIGIPASTLITQDAQEDDTTAQARSQPSTSVGADTPLRRYAGAFQNPDNKPLMSIVLMDDGVDLDAQAIGLPALARFPYPVSFAVDVRLVDAAKRMERYRAEGFDVLATVDLPAGARPTDAEVSLSVALNGLPEIIGVLEGTGEGLQGNRDVADQVTGILKASGHGLVTQNKGLNSMPKLALKEGVPAAPVFRDFDSKNQTARIIRRFLDQAAFKAGQEGGVIMLGRLRPETIEALLVWGLADRAGSVALAPVSALLLAR